MKKRRNRLAVVSAVLGFLAMMFAKGRPGPPTLLAIPVGLTAACLGVVALWFIWRSRGVLRGAGLALVGSVLGVGATCLSIAVLGHSVVIGQFDRDQWRQQQAAHIRRVVERSPHPSEVVTNFSSNLPIIVLDTAGEYIPKNEPKVIRARIYDVKDGRASLGAKPDYDGSISMHLRGSSTLQLPKQSYTVHTLDNKGRQTKVSLLGLPKEEDWVLYAPFEDKTMIRDVLAFELTRRMGHYAPRTKYVELFMSDSDGPLSMRQYAGVYVLMEKIKRGKERVNIAKLTPQDKAEPEISGGYILKRDHRERAESRFQTSRGGPYFFVYPNEREITAEQKAWIRRYFNNFESALYGEDFADAKTGYAAYLDVDAFIDAHWLIELGKNVDGFRYSSFLTKDRGGKIQTGPPWDWNRSFGNANYYGGGQPQGWYSSRLRPNEISWYQRLRQDPAFMRRCSARWAELRRTVFDPKNINALVDQFAAELQQAQPRNFQRWPILGEQITCNYYVGNSYEDEVRWLKKWIERRIAWIDSQVQKTEEE